MARNVNVTWDLPTTRESGGELLPSDILHTEASISVDGVTFTVLNTFLPSQTQALFMPDVDLGDWIVRLVVVDKALRRSVVVDTPFNVPDETAPGTVLNVVVTLV